MTCSRRNLTGFTVTLIVTYSETDIAKFKDANLCCEKAIFSGKSLRNRLFSEGKSSTIAET